MGDGIEKAVMALVPLYLPDQEDGVQNQPGDQQQEKGDANDQQDDAPPVDDDPANVESDGKGDEASAESDGKNDRIPASGDAHVRQALIKSIAGSYFQKGKGATEVAPRLATGCSAVVRRRPRGVGHGDRTEPL